MLIAQVTQVRYEIYGNEFYLYFGHFLGDVPVSTVTKYIFTRLLKPPVPKRELREFDCFIICMFCVKGIYP